MELTYNNGTAFFLLESPDFIGASKDSKNVNKLISKDLISFQITDEIGKLVSGSLTMRDNAGIYSRIFRNGLRFQISWGYKAWNQNILSLGINSLTARGIRQGLNCFIQQPSGSGDGSGQQTYNVTFFSGDLLSGKKNRVFDFGTKYSVIVDCLRELECKTFLINFKDQKDILNTSNSIRQRESTFSFLYRMAVEFNAFYQIGHDAKGNKIGIFVDQKKLDSPSVKAYMKILTDSKDVRELYYNSGSKSNVKSYSWQQNIGESGQGDGVSISYANGQPIFTRYVIEGQNVRTYRLNEDRLRAEFKKQGSSGDVLNLGTQLLNSKNFHDKEVMKFFDPVDMSTAPQGMGYTINCEMHGDPFLYSLQRIKFGNGFPAPLMQSEKLNSLTAFYIRRASHVFSKGEYNTDIEIVDSYNLNGSYIAPEKGDRLVG